MEKKLTIYWTRHAESCSNLASGHVSDKVTADYYMDGNNGYEDRKNAVTINANIATSSLSRLKSTFLYHPNLSFIGMQHGINLGLDFVNNRDIDVICSSPSLRTITTALLAYRHRKDVTIYVIPYITELLNITGTGYIDHQNQPVESKVLKRMVGFIKDWISEKWYIYYDDIEIIRRINYILSFKNSNENFQQFQSMCKKILECRKDNNKSTDVCVKTRLQDLYSVAQSLENYEIKEIINSVDPQGYNKTLEFFNVFKDSETAKKYFRGPNVDFSIYEKIENDENEKKYIFRSYNDTPEMVVTIFNKFYHLIGTEKSLQNARTIHCFSHGSLMRKIFSKKYSDKFDSKYVKDIYNTQTFSESIFNNDYLNMTGNNDFDCKLFLPINIRTMYQNFEKLNMNICDLQSIKGYINYPLWTGNQNGMISNIPGFSFFYDINSVIYPDIKDYIVQTEPNNRVKYFNEKYNTNIIEGGCPCIKNLLNGIKLDGGCSCAYKYKYLQYKNKYSELKKQK